MTISQRSIFHPWLTVWLPLALFALQCVLEVTLSNDLLDRLVSENGVYEILQFFLAFCASGLAVRVLVGMGGPRFHPLFFIWTLCFSLGCFYIAMEEISWGQSFFLWATPDGWSTINDQQETNLHNVSDWLDQKPKSLVLFGILVGGVIFPLLERYTKIRLPERFRPVYPPLEMIVIALCIAVIKISDLVDEALPDIALWARDAEIEEFFLIYYLLLYIAQLGPKMFSLPRRLK